MKITLLLRPELNVGKIHKFFYNRNYNLFTTRKKKHANRVEISLFVCFIVFFLNKLLETRLQRRLSRRNSSHPIRSLQCLISPYI
jgi:hypothetical protein